MSIEDRIKSNSWDDITKDFLPVLKRAIAPDRFDRKDEEHWSWARNSECKYIDLRIDMRDGGCIIRNRGGMRISPARLAWQYSKDTPNPPDGSMQVPYDVVTTANAELLAENTKQGEEIARLVAENTELTKKGEGLCNAYGNSLIEIHDLKRQVEAAKAWLESVDNNANSPKEYEAHMRDAEEAKKHFKKLVEV